MIARGAAWVFVAGCTLLPLAALLMRCARDAPGASAGTAVAATTHWRLIGYSTMLAAAAAVCSLAAGIAAAPQLSRLSLRRPMNFGVVCAALCLLSPPMVSAFGWQRATIGGDHRELMCILTWTGWLWPVPGLIVASAWRSTGRTMWEAARLTAGRAACAVYVLAPLLRRPIAASLAIVFGLAFSDYAVPHAYGLIVHSTALLSVAQSSDRAADVVRASMPSMVMLASVVGVLAAVRSPERQSVGPPPAAPAARAWQAVPVVYFVLHAAVPLAALIRTGSIFRDVAETIRQYWPDLAWSFLAALAGALCVLLATLWIAGPQVGLDSASRRPLVERPSTGRAATVGVRPFAGRLSFLVAGVCWLLTGLLPGAVVGLSLIALFNRPLLGAVYDGWPIVAIAFAARYGWIIVAGVYVARRLVPLALLEQAAIDGATSSQSAWRVALPTSAPVLGAAALAAVALSLGELPATALVRVPGFTPIAHLIIEKYHRLEDGMLTALCLMLWLMTGGLAALVAASAGLAGRRSCKAPAAPLSSPRFEPPI